ncbi:EAL domain-containing protein [Pigmentiphaga kullae]|uniref:Diguanylate cyclase/phosphodiesterase n=1 Tax=Pigmentiphaga kullae TaxID=151784 RepID=A0A4Q7N7T8_9BURK|nr:EAL domain-containing protein [Pigmentiphaga kullae]RZS78126.1 diguanylate cyclase/phosphodiesterase [Pigmentiphaga kullae]
MQPPSAEPSTRIAWVTAKIDWFLSNFSYYLVPAAIFVFSLVALTLEHSIYDTNDNRVLPFAVVADKTGQTPSEALATLASAPAVRFHDTRLAETPFWFRFTVPPSNTPQSVELPSRHAQEVSCWNAAGLAPLGAATRGGTSGILQSVKSGFALDLGVHARPLDLLCRAHFSGPARITVEAWPKSELALSHLAYHHATGVLEGGLLTLAVLTLMTALINRDARYLLFAIWLVGNLRLGGITMGFDTQWLERTIPVDWMAMTRKLTIAAYYIVTYTLFAQFMRTELSRVGYGWLLRAGSRAGLVLLVLAVFLSFAAFLPAMWVVASFGIFVVIFFLARIVIVTRSRIALWYAAALGIVLFSTFSEVIAAAFDFKALVGALNSVTAALASSLVAAFAFAEQIRVERVEREHAEAELQRAYEVTPVGLFTLEPDGRFVRANTAMQEKLGLEGRPLHELRWQNYFEPGALARLKDIADRGGEAEIQAQPIGGMEPRWYLAKATLAHTRIEGSLQDITERRKATERLRFLANNDTLTGALNRRGIEHILEASLKQFDPAHPIALAYLDLDRFKLINDLYGHQTGDEVLKQVCQRVKWSLGEDHHVGRIGGDEFILVLRDTAMLPATDLCRRIISDICDMPFQLRRRSFQVKVSIGLIEITPEMRVQDAVSAADRACREAKKGKHGHLVIYKENAPAFQERAEELRLIEELGSTFTPTGLSLVMQPIMSLRAPEASLDFEVLIRMQDSSGAMVPAGKIIAAAEANGTIGELDKWVLTSTLVWLTENLPRLPNTRFVCVNLSGASLNDEAFIEDTFRILSRFGPVVKYLCMEITESVALHDIANSRRFIDRLKSCGAKIALDDFGAGYTSFSYLKEFAADALKIDGGFIKRMHEHPANYAIVEAIVELARNLGMRSIAEWVEDYPTVEALAELGVDYVQGWAIAKPMAPDEILRASSAASFITDEQVRAFVAGGSQPGASDGMSAWGLH